MIPQMATDALVACRLTGEVRWTFCMPHLLRCGNFCMPLWRGGACGGEVRWTFCMPHLLLCGNFCMPLSGAGEGRWTFCMPCVVKRLV